MYPVDMLFFWAANAPSRPAIVQPDMVVTYDGLADAIASASQRIAELNLDRNEPVAVCIESPAKLLSVCYALLHRGLSAAPVGRGDLLYLASAGIKTVIYETEGFVSSGGRNIRFEDSWLSRPRGSGGSGVSRPHHSDHASSLIFFTSGTTGRPKKIVHTCATQLHRLYVSSFNGGGECSTILLMPGLNSGLGFNRASDVLFKGSTLCIGGLVETIVAFAAMFHVQAIIASPAQAAALVEHTEKNPGHELGSLQAIRITGSRISKDMVTRIQSTLCRKVFIEYGSTEAGVIAIAPYDMIQDVPGAAGIVTPWAEIEIVDDAGAVLARGQEGIVRCRTEFFSASFAANNPGSGVDPNTAWWYPGDIGRLDERGVLAITGRTDDLINRGGVKMSAVAIDELIGSFTDIRDAGACAMPGHGGIDELWVAVVPRRPIDISALKQRIEEDGQLPMRIDRLFEVEEIPRTDLGKIRRGELRERLQALQARSPQSATTLPAT